MSVVIIPAYKPDEILVTIPDEIRPSRRDLNYGMPRGYVFTDRKVKA